MKRLTSLLCAVVAVTACAGAALAQNGVVPAREYSFGSWTIGVYHDASPKLLFCMASTPSDTGSRFALAHSPRGGWSMLVRDPRADWGKGEDFPVSWQVDGFQMRDGKASVNGGNAIVFGLSETALDEFRYGRGMWTSIGGRKAQVKLNDSAGAMRELERCVANDGKPPAPIQPQARPADPPTDPKTIRLAGWRLEESTDKSGRRICAAVSTNAAGTTMVFLYSTGEWDIAFSNRSWTLGDGKRVELPYRIDGGPAHAAQGRTLSERTVVVRRSSDEIDEISRGRELAFEMAGVRHVMNIAGTAQVVPVLRDCVESGLAAVRPTPAAPAPQQTRPPSAAPPASPSGPDNPPGYTSGGWRFQQFNDSQGRFENCFGLAPRDGPMRFGLQLYGDRRWAVLLYNDGWKHGHGQRISVLYRVDNRSSRDEQGLSYKDTGLSILLSGGRQAANEFAAGSVATFIVGGETFAHGLSGSAAAIAELERCVDRGTGTTRPAAPRPQAAPQPPQRPSGSPSRSEAPVDPQLGEPGFRPSQLFRD